LKIFSIMGAFIREKPFDVKAHWVCFASVNPGQPASTAVNQRQLTSTASQLRAVVEIIAPDRASSGIFGHGIPSP
jgi:hypothetical protein